MANPTGKGGFNKTQGINKNLFIPLIDQGLSITQIAKELNITYSQAKYWIRMNNLKTIYKNYNKNKLIYGNSYPAQIQRGLKRKIQFIKELGGKCNKCGYNKNIANLCFHHIKPETKKLKLDMRHLSNNSEKTLRKELVKCILLCHNCHNELHHPQLDNLL